MITTFMFHSFFNSLARSWYFFFFESEKIEKYQDLARELKKLWNMKVVIIPVIIGTLGTTPKNIRKRMDEIGIKIRISDLQKTTIIHSARILRKVLEI